MACRTFAHAAALYVRMSLTASFVVSARIVPSTASDACQPPAVTSLRMSAALLPTFPSAP
ncbi:hypothetical protein D3C72_1965670 [compost metagenome]